MRALARLFASFGSSRSSALAPIRRSIRASIRQSTEVNVAPSGRLQPLGGRVVVAGCRVELLLDVVASVVLEELLDVEIDVLVVEVDVLELEVDVTVLDVLVVDVEVDVDVLSVEVDAALVVVVVVAARVTSAPSSASSRTRP